MRAMRLLLLDLAVHAAPVAALAEDGALRAFALGARNEHARKLAAALETLGQEGWLAKLDAIVVGVGPGSFTGVRLALASAAGLIAVHNTPLVELSSLAITAAQTARAEPVWVVEDARAGFAYLGCWQGLVPVKEEACVPVAELPKLDAFAAHEPPAGIGGKCLPLVRARAEAMRMLAEEALAKGMVVKRFPRARYLQPSQAERNAA